MGMGLANESMGMDLFRQQNGWSLQLQSGQEITLTPGPKDASEPLCLTDVFLVGPGSAAGQGVVAACVEVGSRNIVLAVLSSERPRVELQTPLVLDEQFCFYLVRPGGDADVDAEADAVVVQFQGYALPSASTGQEEEEDDDDDDNDDRIAEENLEEEEVSDGNETEDDEDATGSDYEDYDSRADGEVCGLPLGTVIDDGPIRDDEEEDCGGDGEVGRRVTRASGGKVPPRHRSRSFVTEAEGRSLGGRRRVAPEAVILAIFVFVYLMAMLALFVRG